MLTEEEIDPYRRPTKNNIRMALYWLVQGCQPGDSLVFHYAGHGSQKENFTGDEPLPPRVKLHAIIDACHSGTILDLPFRCKMDRYVWKDHRPRSGMWKGSNGGEVISFSGCDDDQKSEDTSVLSRIGPLGAMTYSFIQAMWTWSYLWIHAKRNAVYHSNMDDDDLGGDGSSRQV
ncbi:hypothetical protein SLA2020_407360 [Shorea laevis]